MVPTYLITEVTAFRLIREGCDTYLATVVDTIKVSMGVMEVLVIRDFLDVCLDELSRLPLYREVDFKIEIVPGAAPISIAPYRMAPLELKELEK